MKKRIVFVAAVCWVLAAPAVGQRVQVKTTIPFPFTAGDRAYPAGKYAFSSQKDTVTLERGDGSGLTMLLVNHLSGSKAERTGQVVFECYDEQCFLSQVWIPAQDNGRQLLRSHRELRVAERKSGKYMALLGEK